MFATKSHNNAAKQKPSGPFFSPLVQPKLKVNKPGDKYEQEADSIAGRVAEQSGSEVAPLSVVKGPVLQRKIADDDAQAMFLQRSEEEDSVQAMEEEEMIQAKENTSRSKVTDSTVSLKSTKGSGSALQNDIKQPLEAAFNSDFSGVKIHTGSKAEQLTGQLKAKAFTHNNDIYFNQGQFNPNSKTGKFLLAHELTHTLQQGASKQNVGKANKTKDGSININSKIGKAGDSKEEKGTFAPKDPLKDPAFKAVIAHTNAVSKQQKSHQPAAENKKEINEASHLSAAEQTKKNDQQAHISSMSAVADAEKKKEPITAESFKNLLQNNLNTLEKQIPRNEKEAKNFKKQKPIQAIKQNIAGTVTSESQKLSGPISAESKKTEPPKSSLPTHDSKEIPAKSKLPQPSPINSKAAIPKPKHPSEVSMQKESQSLDNFMSDNEITDKQLKKSNEPKFLEALDGKNKAQSAAAEAPQRYRLQENAVLKGAQNQAQGNAAAGFMAMQNTRGQTLHSVHGKQNNAKTANQAEQAKIFKVLEKIYNSTKTNVSKILDGLSSQVNSIFETKAEAAKSRFEKNVEKKLADIYGWTVIDDWLFGEDKLAIEKVFQQEKAVFVSSMNKVLDDIAKLIVHRLNQALKEITNGKQKADEYFNSLSEEQKQLSQDAFQQFTDKYVNLENTVHEKQKELAKSLAQQYKQNVNALSSSFDKIKADVSAGWIGGALTALKEVAETIRKLKVMVTGLLAAITSVISVILKDPVGFVKNLFTGIKQGFLNFAKNIKKHLLGGLITWLTGALGPVGITIPEKFDLSGIFSLVMQVLGLGWDFVRKKAVLLLGEPAVQVLEKSVEMFKLIKEKGILGIWELVKEKFTDIKETLINEIRNMLIVQVIGAGIKWVVSLLVPAAGFVKAIMSIYNVITFFVQSAMMLIPAITKSILALASGSIKFVAKAVENVLALSIPIVLNFLAKLLGIGNLAGKVSKIIGKLRKRIEKQITKLILKAKKKLKSLLKNGKKKVKGAVKGIVQWWKKKKKFKTKDGKIHTLFFKGKGKKAKLIVRSEPQTIDEIIHSKKWKIGKESSQSIPLDENTIKALKKQTAIIKPKRDSMSKQDGKDIQKAFIAIVNILDGLGLPALPKTSLVKNDLRPNADGVKSMGEHVKVEPLSLNPGNLAGSQPTIDSTMGYDLKEKYTGKWVAGHLLNHKMHGPGYKRWNLTPLSQKTNSKMKVQSENPAKTQMLGKGKVLSYSVKVNYKANYDETATSYPKGQVADSIDMDINEMEHKDGSWKIKPTKPAWAIKASKPIKHNLSGMVANSTSRTKINFNIARVSTMSRLSAIGPVRAGAIRDYRNEQKRANPAITKVFKNYNDLKNAKGIGQATVDKVKKSNLPIIF